MTSNSKPGMRTLVTKFIRRNLVPFESLSESEKFFKRGGNELLIPLGLEAGTTCIDFGGYKGDWVQSCINNGNKSSIIVFEAIPEFAEYISEVTKGNPLIHIIPHALSADEQDVYISIDGAASSFHLNASKDPSEQVLKIHTKPYSLLKELVGSRRIDWMKINIEGAEYELLEYLFQSTLIRQVETLVVQFHEMNSQRLESFHELLSETHRKSWGYEYVWERWDLKRIISN